MTPDAAQAPTHAVPSINWWAWGGVAAALHVGVAALVWWLAGQSLLPIAGGTAQQNKHGNEAPLTVQRLMWASSISPALASPSLTATPAAKSDTAAKPQPVRPTAQAAQTPRAPAGSKPTPTLPPTPLPTRPQVAKPASDLATDHSTQPAHAHAHETAGANAGTTAATTASELGVGSDTSTPQATTDNKALSAAQSTAQNTQRGSAPLAANTASALSPLSAPVGDSAPSVLQAYSPAPSYPPLSQRMGEQGEVLLRVQVSATGNALAVELAKPSGFERLDRAAMQTVSTWRFVPAMLDGQAQTAWFEVPVRFELR